MKYLERDSVIRSRRMSHAMFMASADFDQIRRDELVKSRSTRSGKKAAYVLSAAFATTFIGTTTPLIVSAESFRESQQESTRTVLSEGNKPDKGVSDNELKVALQGYTSTFKVRESKPAPTPQPTPSPEIVLVGDEIKSTIQQPGTITSVSDGASGDISAQVRALLDKIDIQKVASVSGQKDTNSSIKPVIVSSLGKSQVTPITTEQPNTTNINSDAENVEPADEDIITATPVPTFASVPTSTPTPRPSATPRKEVQPIKYPVEVKQSEEFGRYGFHLDGFYDKDEIVTCGSAKYPSNRNCGHGGIGYPKICIPGRYRCVKDAQGNLTYTEALKEGNDIRPEGVTKLNNYQLNFPYAITKDGAVSLTFTLYSGPRTIGRASAPTEWGYGYVWKADLDADHYLLWNVAHVNRISSPKESHSGGKLSTIWPNLDGTDRSHSHISFQIVNKKTGKTVQVEPKELGVGTDHNLKELLSHIKNQ